MNLPTASTASADETTQPGTTGGFTSRTAAPQAPQADPDATGEVPEDEMPESIWPTSGASPSASSTPTAATDASECERGQTALVQSVPAVFEQLGMEQAWTVATGQGVIVAVVDSGVDASNPHLTHALVKGVDLTGADSATTDSDGLGTAVAGVISARAVSGSGLTGLARDAGIMPVRVLTDTSRDAVEAGTGPRADRTAAGITWAADNGARIIVVPRALSEGSAELAAAVDHASAAGALVVASTGDQEQETYDVAASAQPTAAAIGTSRANRGTEDDPRPRYPAAYEGVLGVTALDTNGAASDTALQGEHVDLSAPGQSVLTAFFGDGDCVLSQQAPSSALATGYAGAVAALVASAHGPESPADWAYRLTVTALRTSPSEHSPATGWGLVAPYAAIEFVNDGSAPGPPNPRGGPEPTAPAVAMATPPSADPAPARRRKLATSVGLLGAVTLTLAMVASKTGGGAQRHARRGD